MGVSVRADATNSSIWRRQKLHVTEVAVGYTDSDADPDTAAEFPVHRHLSDLQVLPSGTADQVQGVMAKQLQALCVPSWEDVLTEVKCGKLNARSIFFFMDTTDCGPDQNSRKRKILARIHDQQLQAGLCNVIYLPSACLLHQYHLICDTGLKYIDACLSSSTFSRLAKTI